MYLAINKKLVRVCIHRDPKDNLFHCTCGLKLATVEDVQRHGEMNEDEDHPRDFFSLFIGTSNK